MTRMFAGLTSQRLILRPLLASDAAGLCGYRSDPQVARYQSWTGFDEADAIALIAEQEDLEPDLPGTWLQLALIETASNMMVGDCGLHFLESDTNQVELGITLSRSHQRQGYGAEAVRRVLVYLFDELGKHRVFAITDADNHAAVGLFRRLGFRQEAHFVEHVYFKGTYGSEFVFAMLAREWPARPAS
ncbi:GNAT family N-acetyltransferase [Lichenicola cladoniae]|uniref:GNAT family N-acetyltransferase n=1 Tax=Lichenicola cladoniae TaxID=1484109 RepID=A0A6M8HNV1_9PROT|nr:GNAT family protein [Lichenicola cladoniae]NPD68484.1 GNAT family N-acetyltransferase [Acetobacteraceae bacterium]QKE90038.1 GNAT family N-acetyltransferase [Lichenicola cladoniae]